MRSLFTKIILLSISFFFLLGTVDARAQGIENITECTDFPGWLEFVGNENKNSNSFKISPTLLRTTSDSNLCRLTTEANDIFFYHFCKNPNFEFTTDAFIILNDSLWYCKDPNINSNSYLCNFDKSEGSHSILYVRKDSYGDSPLPDRLNIRLTSLTTNNAFFEHLYSNNDSEKVNFSNNCSDRYSDPNEYECEIKISNDFFSPAQSLASIDVINTYGGTICAIEVKNNQQQTDTPPFIPPPQQDPDNPNDPGPNSAPISLNSLNPLNFSSDSTAKAELSTPGGIISRALRSFVFPIAGMILFVMLVWGGFEILSKSTNQNAMQAGKQRITAAIIGFILLFVAYWVLQLIQFVFGISVL